MLPFGIPDIVSICGCISIIVPIVAIKFYNFFIIKNKVGPKGTGFGRNDTFKIFTRIITPHRFGIQRGEKDIMFYFQFCVYSPK